MRAAGIILPAKGAFPAKGSRRVTPARPEKSPLRQTGVGADWLSVTRAPLPKPASIVPNTKVRFLPLYSLGTMTGPPAAKVIRWLTLPVRVAANGFRALNIGVE